HLSQSGAGLMITASRRTPPALMGAIDAATRGAPRVLWTGSGENPYAQFLAHAGAFLVTADSVNMAGEAAATGKPVHVFHPSGGSAKFDRLHAALEGKGITRRILGDTMDLAEWTYPPLDAAREIANEIERRWSKRARLIPGLCNPGPR
ncbi:MAG: ELM1/GtrOC1 family putative glycosyltransferase, partial [Hyphomicrobium sp.]